MVVFDRMELLVGCSGLLISIVERFSEQPKVDRVRFGTNVEFCLL